MITVEKIDDTLVDSKALTLNHYKFGPAINGVSFQQSALASFDGYQYVVYYDSERRVCIGRRKLADQPWKIIHTEPGPFINEMLGDRMRFKTDHVLSVMVQQDARKKGDPKPLRVLDFSFEV